MYGNQIQQGVQWLDDNRPGWREQINPRQLEMRTARRCILGQLYSNAAGSWARVLREAGLNNNTAITRGFTVDGYTARDTEWETLTAEWRAELAKTPTPTPAVAEPERFSLTLPNGNMTALSLADVQTLLNMHGITLTKEN